jgi:polar amino acid transport system permease protein
MASANFNSDQRNNSRPQSGAEEASASVADWTLSPLELDRRALRKRQNVRSVLLSVLSAIVLFGGIILILANSEGWQKVQQTFFDGFYFQDSFPSVLRGLLTNLRILVFASIGTAIISLLLAIARTSTHPLLRPLRFVSLAYTTLIRGVPMIVLLYIIGFGIPTLGFTETRIDPALLGTIAIVVGYSAYVSEVIRAGIEAVHPSQKASARSLGLTSTQTLRIVVLPQAIRKVIPPLMNDFVAMQKDVGLVSVLGVMDSFRSAQIEVAHSFNYTPYIVSAVVFILMSLPVILLSDWYSKRVQLREFAQTGI